MRQFSPSFTGTTFSVFVSPFRDTTISMGFGPSLSNVDAASRMKRTTSK